MRQWITPITSMLLVLTLFTMAVAVDLAVRGLRRFPRDPVLFVPDGDAARGRAAIVDHGCGTCHVVPGIRTAKGRVGPKLEDLREQIYLAGVLPNTPEHLVHWIQHPRQVNPRTAMPDLGVTESEARDMAAYLYGPR